MQRKDFDLSSLVRLLIISLLIALLTSRITVVFHEFLGHALVGFLAGGKIKGFSFYLFGNANLSAAFKGLSFPRLLCSSVAGIAVQLIVGSVLLLVQRKLKRGSLARMTVVCFGAIIIVEGLWYLAVSTYGGFSDGGVLNHLLGQALPYFIILLSLVLLVAAYFLTRLMRDHIIVWLPDMPRYKMSAIFLLCLLFAGGVHLILTLGEARYFPAPAYTFARQVPQTQDSKAMPAPAPPKEINISEVLDDIEERAKKDEPVVEQPAPITARPFPFFWVINGALLVTVLLASYPFRVRFDMQTQNTSAVPSWRSVFKLFVIFLLSLLPIIFLRFPLLNLFHPRGG